MEGTHTIPLIVLGLDTVVQAEGSFTSIQNQGS